MFEAHQEDMQADIEEKDVRVEALEVSIHKEAYQLTSSGSTCVC